MEKVAAENLPPGYGYEWTGTTYQEKLSQGHEGVIFGFASVLVFLCLAALYESWSIPLAVLLSLPLGLFGALLAVYLRHYPYDIYTQIGIVTLIGLAAKNAILIVEFAKDSHDKEGMSARDAALHAARLRLRPILMTSFAFILGVVPLVVATGAAAARRSLGTAVFGGMLAATLLAIFFVPVQYYFIENIIERRQKRRQQRTPTGNQTAGVRRLKPRSWIIASLSLALTGCTVGPNYHRPQIAVPDQFRNAAPGSRPELDRRYKMVRSVSGRRAEAAGHHRASQQLRFANRGRASPRSARAIRNHARRIVPTLDAQGQFTASRTSSVGSFQLHPKGSNLSTSYTQAALSLSWEIDLWGRVQRLSEAARAQYLASEEARHGVTISLISDVTNAYFSLREQDLELEISQQARDVAADDLRLINLRHDQGAASGLDVHQAEQLALYIATSQIERVQRSIHLTEDQVSLLLGSIPADVPRGKLEEIISAPELQPACLRR